MKRLIKRSVIAAIVASGTLAVVTTNMVSAGIRKP
jgi:hypothetical protein